MRVLSLGLRGFAAAPGFEEHPRYREAGLSVMTHGLALAALAVSPLFNAIEPPLAKASTFSAPLVEPVRVSLPARRPPAGPQRTRANRTAPVVSAPNTTELQAPTTIPTTLNSATDLLQSEATSGGTGDGTGGTGTGVGDCLLGTLCGTSTLPAAPSAPVETVRVGGLIREPRLLSSRLPVYPPVAQAAGVAGTVRIEAHVGVDGRIVEAKVLEGHPLFDEAALASVRSRRYEALLLNGVPTDFLVTITVSFSVRR